MSKKYVLRYLDTCTSDYFRGYHNDVVQVVVDGATTLQDIKDMMLDVYWSTDHIEDLDDAAYKLAVEELFRSVSNMEELYDYSIEVCPEGEELWEYCYAFFGLDTVEDEENEEDGELHIKWNESKQDYDYIRE
ncbi:hypothetical protein UFOVP1516_39 [uncultured Caudovirales phage]|uniref:Uncharacterized protein n=1 Tax=uncultured Caudovirales phage TaxID=2100421 RepID=A0A6J7X7E7_9CAUD|nr:hypothetical protein UFOVP887_5 [uncultured Caudovirales phage]CAB5226840.1 hypothetical protein UFOVP1516_39 [uncultured Caudovirales phage]